MNNLSAKTVLLISVCILLLFVLVLTLFPSSQPPVIDHQSANVVSNTIDTPENPEILLSAADDSPLPPGPEEPPLTIPDT